MKANSVIILKSLTVHYSVVKYLVQHTSCPHNQLDPLSATKNINVEQKCK